MLCRLIPMARNSASVEVPSKPCSQNTPIALCKAVSRSNSLGLATSFNITILDRFIQIMRDDAAIFEGNHVKKQWVDRDPQPFYPGVPERNRVEHGHYHDAHS